jgi:hypothetical protein
MHLILATVLIVAGLAIVWRAWHGATKSCDWKRMRANDRGALLCYRCANCGEEGFSATGGPPNTCRRTAGKATKL